MFRYTMKARAAAENAAKSNLRSVRLSYLEDEITALDGSTLLLGGNAMTRADAVRALMTQRMQTHAVVLTARNSPVCAALAGAAEFMSGRPYAYLFGVEKTRAANALMKCLGEMQNSDLAYAQALMDFAELVNPLCLQSMQMAADYMMSGGAGDRDHGLMRCMDAAQRNMLQMHPSYAVHNLLDSMYRTLPDAGEIAKGQQPENVVSRTVEACFDGRWSLLVADLYPAAGSDPITCARLNALLAAEIQALTGMGLPLLLVLDDVMMEQDDALANTLPALMNRENVRVVVSVPTAEYLPDMDLLGKFGSQAVLGPLQGGDREEILKKLFGTCSYKQVNDSSSGRWMEMPWNRHTNASTAYVQRAVITPDMARDCDAVIGSTQGIRLIRQLRRGRYS